MHAHLCVSARTHRKHTRIHTRSISTLIRVRQRRLTINKLSSHVCIRPLIFFNCCAHAAKPQLRVLCLFVRGGARVHFGADAHMCIRFHTHTCERAFTNMHTQTPTTRTDAEKQMRPTQHTSSSTWPKSGSSIPAKLCPSSPEYKMHQCMYG